MSWSPHSDHALAPAAPQRTESTVSALVRSPLPRPPLPRPPLPEWVEPRDYQRAAVDAIVAAFAEGNEIVYLDAPTGSGKTAIAELVRRELDMNAVYLCTDKNLQAQFMRDFSAYAHLLQGRSNYRTQYGDSDTTAEDCTASDGSSCMWCDGAHVCPYQIAKRRALESELAVLNTAYFLSEANYVGMFSAQDLIIIDEGDALEGALMGFIEYSVPEWIGKRLGLTYPIKSARKKTLVKWCEDAAGAARDYLIRHGGALELKEQRRMRAWITETVQLAKELARDAARDPDSDDEDSGQWLRTYETRTFAMQPVLVSRYGAKNLWRHGKRFLIMSATIISPDEMSDSLGVPFDWSCVQVPMMFPVEHRPIILAPVANVSYKLMDDAVPKLAYAIERIIERHPGERILVHTVSYDLTKRLVNRVQTTRPVVTYTQAREKHAAIERYLRTEGAVMFSPSMERGVDLKGDACTVQIVAKCPFPSLKDRRISARTRLPGGDQWYKVQTIRDIVQMTGRGVRDVTDRCTTYILDEQFTKNVWRSKSLFPKWWQEAVDKSADIRPLIMPRVPRTQVSRGSAASNSTPQ